MSTGVTTIVGGVQNLERYFGDLVNLLGDDLLPLLTLAIGGALALGTLAALARPRTAEIPEGELARPPLGRSLIQIAIGATVSIWAIASLLG
jgi:hypothetical protein